MPEGIKAEEKELAIGRKIKRLRQKRKLTLQDLSGKTGIPKPLLSQIEDETVAPPISTLMKIAKGLDVDITFFFQEAETYEKVVVVKSHERERLDSRYHGRADSGYFYEALAFKKGKKHMEPFLVEFEVKEKREMAFFSHEGEEFVFVLEGEVEFRTPEEVHILSPGDSLYFESDQPHAFRGIGQKSARAVVVVYTPG